MKPKQMPTWLTRTLLVGLGAILILMPIHAFVSTWGGTAIGPLWLWKSWKEILIALLTLVTSGWLVCNPSVLWPLLKKPLVLTLVAYLLLTVILAVLYRHENGTDATMAGLAMNLRYLGVAALGYLLFRYSKLPVTWLAKAGWVLVGAGVLMSIVGIIQVLVLPSGFLAQFGYNDTTTISPNVLIDNDPDLLRAFATLRGPNDFGAFLILPIILVIAQLRRLPVWFSAASLTVMGWALLLSGSRSAWIGALIAVAVYLVTSAGKAVSKKQLVGAVTTAAFLGLVTFYAAVNIPVLRMAIFHSSPGDSSLTEGSTDDHLSATLSGVERVVENPLGCGPGCAGPASYYGDSPQISENYFVQIAEETGVVGLILFLLLVGLVAYALYTQSQGRTLSKALFATLIGYGAIGLLLHVWSDDPLSITWWMLVGALIGYNESQQWKKSKNNSHSRTS